jgi:molybdopterin synthase catalytic subunit
MVKLQKEPIDILPLVESLKSPLSGSIVFFLGIPRRSEEDGFVKSIEYSAYEEMAIKELKKIEEEALKRKGILDIIIVHRVGTVPLKETSLFVGASSAHREEGFDVAQWVVDEIKKTMPIWKEIKYENDRHG